MELDDMTIIEHYPTVQAAEGQAAYLVERGVGAAVGAPDDSGSFGLSVLSDDAERAREVLGLTEVVEREEPTQIELIGSARPLLIPVLLIGLAMVVIPIVAFLVTFKLSGG
jgi:hypothetical protein